MPKAYWIARVDVNDANAHGVYVEAAGPAFAEFGAKFLARGGRSEAVEGAARARNVVIEFPSFDAAIACYRSPAYQAARAHRLQASEVEIVIVEGLAS